jgi:hypothetical protein
VSSPYRICTLEKIAKFRAAAEFHKEKANTAEILLYDQKIVSIWIA